ncbi:MAG: hypothetical protein WCH11_05150, partial [Bdellovibrio sp.]
MLKMLDPSPSFPNTPQFQVSDLLDHFQTLQNASASGFTRVADRPEIREQCQSLLSQLETFSQLLVVGVGGSSLGAQAMDQWLCLRKKKSLFFLDNLDPWQFSTLLQEIEPRWSQTAFLFVSKSGGSLETLATLDLLVQKYGSDLIGRSFVISENQPNPLRSWAEKQGRPSIDFPEDIGGRFSVLSQSGLVPAGFLGLQVTEALRGARDALQAGKEIAALAQLVLQSWQQGKLITQFWLYSSQMKAFGAWLEQLWSESLGKSLNLDGGPAAHASTPMLCIGSSHQHSLLQQLVEGQKDKLVILIRVKAIEESGETIRTSEFE